MAEIRKVPGDQTDRSQGEKVEQLGRLGSHQVKIGGEYLLQSGVNVNLQKKEEFSADRTVPDGDLTLKTDFLGRSFIFHK